MNCGHRFESGRGQALSPNQVLVDVASCDASGLSASEVRPLKKPITVVALPVCL